MSQTEGYKLVEPTLHILKACRDQLVNYEHDATGEVYNWTELNDLIDSLAAPEPLRVDQEKQGVSSYGGSPTFPRGSLTFGQPRSLEVFQFQFAHRLQSTGQSGRKAAANAGVSVATFNRVCRGHPPDIETYFKLLDWIEGAPIAKAEGST